MGPRRPGASSRQEPEATGKWLGWACTIKLGLAEGKVRTFLAVPWSGQGVGGRPWVWHQVGWEAGVGALPYIYLDLHRPLRRSGPGPSGGLGRGPQVPGDPLGLNSTDRVHQKGPWDSSRLNPHPEHGGLPALAAYRERVSRGALTARTRAVGSHGHAYFFIRAGVRYFDDSRYTCRSFLLRLVPALGSR